MSDLHAGFLDGVGPFDQLPLVGSSVAITGTANLQQEPQTLQAVGSTPIVAAVDEEEGLAEWVPVRTLLQQIKPEAPPTVTGTAALVQAPQTLEAEGRNKQRVTGRAQIAGPGHWTIAMGEYSTARRDERDLLELILLNVA